jgi:hypothetical protein
MEAPAPSRCHGCFDKIQMIGQYYPSLGVDQHLLPSRATRSARAKLVSAFDRHSAALKSVNMDLVSIGEISIRLR